jgi:hypothetical protein
LNRLDLQNHPKRNHRLHAYASDITSESATFHLETWGNSVLNGAALCYIAFPKNKKKVDSGTFSTHDVEKEVDQREIKVQAKKRVSNRVEFREGWFNKSPTVLCALNMFDMGGEGDLKIKVEVDQVDKEGFTWHLSTWVCFFCAKVDKVIDAD